MQPRQARMRAPTGACPRPPSGLSWMQSGARATERRGLSWMSGGTLAHQRRGLSWMQGVIAALGALLLLMTVMPAAQASEASAAPAGEYVLQATDLAAARDAIEATGGTVLTELPTVRAITAELPAGAADRLAGEPSIASYSPNLPLQLLGWDGKESKRDKTGDMERVRGPVTGARDVWKLGADGSGIDIALIDSGVAAVDGLRRSGKVLHGPDLSFESQDPDLTNRDTFGHGTHLAGIMAGQDDATPTPSKISSNRATQHFMGMAPGARIISLKVADANGATDVSQVIAAIDWVVQHRSTDGLNIRVLNLSFGTDSAQDYRIDPLSYAVEVAWRHGIVVVVAAGNDGNGAPVRNPAHNPYVVAVGASHSHGTSTTLDDTLPSFSNCGTASRSVDLLAPGKSIISVAAPDSTAWLNHPDAIVDDRFMRGSGTSQAAAVVSGTAALLLDRRPDLSPDQVKALLMAGAADMPLVSSHCQGAGNLNVLLSASLPVPAAVQTHDPATGTGSLDGARGSARLEHDGVLLAGEQDIFGMPWDGASWSAESMAGASWSGGSWNGSIWTGASWSGGSWSGASWSGGSWSGASWSGASWSGASWSGASWNGQSWN